MSGLDFIMSAGEISLAAPTTAKTMFEITAAANHGCQIKLLSFFFDGVTVTDEAIFTEFLRVTGTCTGTAGAEVKMNPDDPEAIQTSFKFNATVEPTGVTVMKRFNIHPQGGYEMVFPIDKPWPVRGGDFFAIRMTIPTGGTAINVVINAECEE